MQMRKVREQRTHEKDEKVRGLTSKNRRRRRLLEEERGEVRVFVMKREKSGERVGTGGQRCGMV